MLTLALKLALAPALVGASTLAARRWGEGLGGWFSAFPVIAGLVLLIDAQEHETDFAARAASGTLLGLVGLSAFAVAYGRAAPRRGWHGGVLTGWEALALTGFALGGVVSARSPGSRWR